MPVLHLHRIKKTDTYILGKLYLNGAFLCYTLENAKKAIPTGEYIAENSKSPKFKRELPLLYNDTVMPTRGIRIHSGNTYKDSQGCVLVGMKVDAGKGTISESRLAEGMVTMITRNNVVLTITSV